jgi:hypothetical protein
MNEQERKIKAYAAHLRRKFNGSTEVIRGIVAKMSDEDLIAAEKRNHDIRLGAISASRQKEFKR